MNTAGDSKIGNDNKTGGVQIALLKKEDIDEIVRSVLDILEERENYKKAKASKIKKFIDTLSEYWFLASVVVILLASLIYRASIFYPLKQVAIADRELDRKKEKFEFEKKMAGHFLELGKKFLDVGKYQDAAQAYSEAIRLDDANIEANFGLHKSNLLAKSEAEQSDVEVIAKRIEVVLKHWPDDSHALAAKANLYYHTGDREKAEQLWLKSLAKDDQLAEAHFGLATLHIEKEEFSEAITALEKAKEIAPFKWEYLNNLASAYAHNGDYEKAVEIYQKIRSLDPDALQPLMEGADALLMLGQLTNSLKVQNELIGGLQNPELMKLEKNSDAWFFSVNGKEVALYSDEMKRVYAYRFRAFIHFMLKNEGLAEQDFKVDNSLSAKENSEVNELLAYNLKTLHEKQPGAINRIKEFRQIYLTKSKR